MSTITLLLMIVLQIYIVLSSEIPAFLYTIVLFCVCFESWVSIFFHCWGNNNVLKYFQLILRLTWFCKAIICFYSKVVTFKKKLHNYCKSKILKTKNHVKLKITLTKVLWPNSPAPLMDNWKVMDDSSINFHDVFFFIFCQIIAKNEEKHVMEIYGWVVHKWSRWIRP